jgi:hypothetical protein
LLVEVETGEIVLAHSGAITRRTRLKIDPVLERFEEKLISVTSARRPTQVIEIARLSDVDLIDKICSFARTMRKVADELGQAREAYTRESSLQGIDGT